MAVLEFRDGMTAHEEMDPWFLYFRLYKDNVFEGSYVSYL